MDIIDITMLCIYAPFALLAIWVLGCLFFRRKDLIPRLFSRWFDNSH